MDTAAKRIRTCATRKAWLTRWRGPEHPDTIRAARELDAAVLARAVAAARAASLDDLDIDAVVRTGQLPAEAMAS